MLSSVRCEIALFSLILDAFRASGVCCHAMHAQVWEVTRNRNWLERNYHVRNNVAEHKIKCLRRGQDVQMLHHQLDENLKFLFRAEDRSRFAINCQMALWTSAILAGELSKRVNKSGKCRDREPGEIWRTPSATSTTPCHSTTTSSTSASWFLASLSAPSSGRPTSLPPPSQRANGCHPRSASPSSSSCPGSTASTASPRLPCRDVNHCSCVFLVICAVFGKKRITWNLYTHYRL